MGEMGLGEGGEGSQGKMGLGEGGGRLSGSFPPSLQLFGSFGDNLNLKASCPEPLRGGAGNNGKALAES